MLDSLHAFIYVKSIIKRASVIVTGQTETLLVGKAKSMGLGQFSVFHDLGPPIVASRAMAGFATYPFLESQSSEPFRIHSVGGGMALQACVAFLWILDSQCDRGLSGLVCSQTLERLAVRASLPFPVLIACILSGMTSLASSGSPERVFLCSGGQSEGNAQPRKKT